jgi:hypothetical protein
MLNQSPNIMVIYGDIYDSLIFAARSQGPKAPKSQAVLVTTWFAPRATAPFMVEPEKTLGDDTRRFHSLSQEMMMMDDTQ